MSIFCFGLSHRTAGVEVRERFAIPRSAANAFRSRGANQIFVSNRSFERAQVLATLTGGRAIHFDDWEPEFRDLDILVSSTAAPHPIITLDKLAPFWKADRRVGETDLASEK